MKLAISIAIVLGLLVIWRLVWRTRPILALGVTIGIMISWVFAVVVGPPQFDTVPLWLPPLPFAVVAVTLFVFGILAWVWGDENAAAAAGDSSARSQHDH